MAKANPKSVIEELGNILQTGNKSFYYRHVVMADGAEGDQFHKESDKLEYLDQLYEDGTEVEYILTPSDKANGEDRIRVNDPSYVPKDDAKQTAGKAPYKGKSEYAKAKDDSDSYWRNKTAFEEKRATVNDAKIERQSIITYISPFYKLMLEQKLQAGEPITKAEVDKMLGYVEAKAKEIQTSRNPE